MVFTELRSMLIGGNHIRVRHHLGVIAILFMVGLFAIPVGRVLWQTAGILWPGNGPVSTTALTGLVLPLILLVSTLAIISVAYDRNTIRLGLSLVTGAAITVLAVWWIIDLFTAELIGLVVLLTALAAIATRAVSGLLVCWGLTAAPVVGYFLTGPFGMIHPVAFFFRLGLGSESGQGSRLSSGQQDFFSGEVSTLTDE